MPDLLLELFSEEIPARMQRQAAEDLRKLVTNALVERGLVYEGAKAFATPRRLALTIAGLPARQPDVREEKKGPRISAPEAARLGFLRSIGVPESEFHRFELYEGHSVSLPERGLSVEVRGAGKDATAFALIERKGSETLGVLAEILPGIIRSFPWPKSMRWGAASAAPGSLRWVRPLRSILATFGAETEDTDIVPFEVDGIRAGNITYGHRFMKPGEIRVKRFDDYVTKLEAAKVVLDADRRKEIIKADAQNLAFAQGLELVEDEGLLEEVAGLVEWPQVLMGSFEEAFLDVPAEVIRATIRANQKCFVLRKVASSPSPLAGAEAKAMERFPSPLAGAEAKAAGALPSPLAGEGARRADEGASANPSPGSQSSPPSPARGEGQNPQTERGLANRFLLTANIVAKDGGKVIIGGNERVIRARLSDAKFFWDTDRKVWEGYRDKARLEAAMKRFEKVTFHEKLGSQWDRIERIRALAKELCKVTGADEKLVERAAQLCKLDLQTEIVGEFPEVQGLMGRKYATLIDEHPSVAAACEEHYKPVGPNDRVPRDPVSVTIALADKLDTLVGFWAIDEKPTGSKDPYALRRAALGVIRLVVENGLRVGLGEFCRKARDIALRQECERLIRENVARYLESYEDSLAAISDVKATLQAGSESPNLFDLLQRDERYNEGARKITPEVARTLAEIHVERYWFVESQAVWIIAESLLSFFHDRLKVMLRDSGARNDLVDAVLANGEANDDLLLIVRRVEALGTFLETEDGKSLLAGAKRATNILRAEEKKDGEGAFEAAADPALLSEPSEKALHAALSKAGEAALHALEKQDFEAAMRAMSSLRAPVDAFFGAVMVNAEDSAIRKNRLALLATLRRVTRQVADFSKIAG